MARPHKIEKYGLGSEVLKLKEDGKSYRAIAEYIEKNYSHIQELKGISPMSIKRYVSMNDTEHMRDIIEHEDDPDSIIEKEFNDKMRDLLASNEDLRSVTSKLMNKALKDDATIDDLVKLINVQNRNLDLMRKNLISLREFADLKIVKPQTNIIFEKKIEVKDMLLDFQKALCPECRQRVNKLMLSY